MAAKAYPIFMEISGNFGMFADPLSGSEAVSYALPPESACRGMLTSITLNKKVDVDVVAVATCTKPEYTNYKFNSVAAVKNSTVVPLQVTESVLFRPCFQIIAFLRPNQFVQGKNHPHFNQEIFFRRLRYGQSYGTPCLGRKEFVASYYGVPRSQVYEDYSATIPSMIMRHLPDPNQRIVRQNVPVEKGVLCFGDPSLVRVRNGVLGFDDAEYQFQLNYLFLGRRPKKA